MVRFIAAPLVLFAFAVARSDIRTRRVPNRLTFTAAAAGCAVNSCMAGCRGWLLSLAGMGLGVAVLIVPFALGWIGGGDLKSLAALGSIGGPRFALVAFLLGSVAAGLWAAALLLAALRYRRPAPTIPYAAFMCLAAAATLLSPLAGIR